MACGLVFAWLYSGYRDGERIPTAAFLLVPVGALAIAGVCDPRLMWSIGPRRTTFPLRIRIIGGMVFAAGVIGAVSLIAFAP